MNNEEILNKISKLESRNIVIRNYLESLSIVYQMILNSENNKYLKSQLKNFKNNLLNKRNVDKYSKVSQKNLSKLINKSGSLTFSGKISETVNTLDSQGLGNYKNDVLELLDSGRTRPLSFEELIKKIDQEYMKYLNELEKNKEEIENLNKRVNIESESEKNKEEEPQKNKESKYELINGKNYDEYFDLLLEKPEKIDYDTIANLYALAGDLLSIMAADQLVSGVDSNHEPYKDKVVPTLYGFKLSNPQNVDKIFNNFQVQNLEELLDKYEKVREYYFKAYSKLNEKKKSMYSAQELKFATRISATSTASAFGSNVGFDVLLENNFTFPPSKEELIKLINQRIMHSDNYRKYCKEDHYTRYTTNNNSELFESGVKYYNNLTKNMTLEEIIKLYERIKYTMDMYEPGYEYLRYASQEEKNRWSKTTEANLVQIQKIFCQVIFEKKGMKFVDQKQYDTAILGISKEYLKEDLKFSINGYDNVNEEQQQKRNNTVYKEYVRYRARLVSEKKKEHMSFQEFVEQTYGLKDVNISLENLEEDIKEEIKRKKK